MIFLLSMIGYLLIIPAVGALAYDLAQFFSTGSFKLSTWGELWFKLHPGSLNLYQAVVERYVSVALWDDVLSPLLFWPALYAFGIPGLALALLPWLQKTLSRDEDFR